MMYRIGNVLFLIALSNSLVFAFQSSRRPITLDELSIEVRGQSREVSFTNKEGGVLYTETNGNYRSSWQGWRVLSHEVLKDYVITLDGIPLQKSAAVRAVVYPHQLQRFYPNGVIETVTMLDSVQAFVVELANVHAREVVAYPLLSGEHSGDEFLTVFERNILMIGSKNHPFRTLRDNYPPVIALSWMGENMWTAAFYDSSTFGGNFSPASMKTVQDVSSHAIVFAVGDSLAGAFETARIVAKNYQTMIASRKDRMEQLLNKSYVRTDNPEFDKALNWAKLSLDALITNHPAKGIYAGLPWFDNYWGRDTYISLPGATLVTGNFEDAKEILRSFARWQEKDSASTNYGRIPNQVTGQSISYNTADGTPRFTIACDDYVKYSGDTLFASEMYPVLKRAVEGTLKYHVDSLGFLRHGDSETWMDAAGPEGPWSPRGNRANDIQSLWYDQLVITKTFAERFSPASGDSKFVASTKTTLEKISKNFQTHFVDRQHQLIYDHLTPNGARDTLFRPNQLFVIDPKFISAMNLPDDDLRKHVFASVTENLVYPHGVASLWQGDENFHPYHHYEPLYVQDAAYHNGIVWTWLAGSWIDCATSYGLQDLAFQVTQSMEQQLLMRGAVGTLSELIDAAPRPGEKEPRLSGAYSQAWSLAEFIRNFYQSYLGVSVDAPQRTLSLNPHLPKNFTKAEFTIAMDTSKIDVSYEIAESTETMIVAPNESKGLRLNLSSLVRNGKGIHGSSFITDGNVRTFIVTPSQIIQNGSALTKTESFSVPSVFDNLILATPVVRPDLRSLRPPPYRLLKNEEVKIQNISPRVLYDVADPEGDDGGTGGTYTYPLTAALRPGSLDITHFTVSTDDRDIFFRLQFKNLSNPGWHPEYGFQLTYVAIAIDNNEKGAKRQTHVGMNSQYALDQKNAFDRIIYVGGGIRVDDAQHNIVAEYLPVEADKSNPLGDEKTKTIEFSLPVQLLGRPNASWRYTVLVGAQDDHGGAGIGDFRSVGGTATEWNGGGKKHPTDSNVYDVILPKK